METFHMAMFRLILRYILWSESRSMKIFRVQLARSALQYGVCPELTPILYTIIRQRCQELSRIQALRQQTQCQGSA